ncbi:MAG: peptidase M38 [Rhodospirillaceae bacterium]|nr:peptidase M38 [Rhodospirillaceae bacterium]|tara:strand:- start:583 stop:1821 length:1239 start_codon:yes stop_codon:yes gene_type:complete
MSSILFENAAILDGQSSERRENHHVFIEKNKIVEVSDKPIKADAERKINLAGKTLMPGLIDAHVHVKATVVNLGRLSDIPISYLTADAGKFMREMLMRGFTSVRDAGGADRGMADAVEDGLLIGPRLFVSGLSLSQTGGHGDLRPTTANSDIITCACLASNQQLGRIADGVDECRRAARDELRKGAHQIKIMAGGGVASPTDPIQNTQYSVEEIKAICEEAEACQTYVMAHAYVPKAIIRAIQNGVRTIEHGNLLDHEAAQIMAAQGAYLVPTNVTYRALHKHGKTFGFPQVSLEKLEDVLEVGLRAIEIARDNGVKIGHGSDLLGECQRYQSDELNIKAEVLGNYEAIRQATEINAEILNMADKLGIIKEQALADILIVDGNPLTDLGRLTGDAKHIIGIMKNGIFYKENF